MKQRSALIDMVSIRKEDPINFWRTLIMETNTTPQTRVRCSDDLFLEAVFSSKTYAEIAEKTGQKIASTMARYARTKKVLADQGITLPEMERKKPTRNGNNIEAMAETARRLQKQYMLFD